MYPFYVEMQKYILYIQKPLYFAGSEHLPIQIFNTLLKNVNKKIPASGDGRG
ncbi:hypothetical protein ACRALDRAFT_210208 [Sodiomyces alcalophilus JCM 7366]|uniref:uncharacterized protein n=1 Tax=Sodiomyces alcalophilus JCM 7366 TaxID=591952 RepID=UPI0039B62B7C